MPTSSRFPFSVALLIAFALQGFAQVHANDWPTWRGPGGNGVSDGKGFPTKWSEDSNIVWKLKLPGPGASTPIVHGDQIFVTSPDGDQNAIVCLDRKGTKVWSTKIGKTRDGKHKKATPCNSSPVTDGEFVFGYFKSGDLACLDMNGKVQWEVNVQKLYGEDTLWWDLGTSPVLTAENIVIACMQSDNSYVAALNKKTGKESWQQTRNLGAPVEAQHSYSTPIVINDGTKETIYILGGDHVTAHNAADGKELWRVGGLNPTNHQYFRSIASPVVSDGYLLAPYARGGSLTGIRLGGKGDVTSSHVAWTNEGTSADVPTPAAIDNKAYVCTDKGKVFCLDVKTGETVWSTELPKHRSGFSASPILADGKIYLTRENGTTYVLDAKTSKLLATNVLEGFTVATPVLVDGQILLRNKEYIYCIGK
jgi:outer membrane protein assembly factor BamB